jgi:hypothetical protein
MSLSTSGGLSLALSAAIGLAIGGSAQAATTTGPEVTPAVQHDTLHSLRGVMPRPRGKVSASGARQLPATFQSAAISCERKDYAAQIDGDHRNEQAASRREPVPSQPGAVDNSSGHPGENLTGWMDVQTMCRPIPRRRTAR